MLTDLSDFFRSLGGMTEGFRERAHRVKAMLADPGTAFVLVTSPEREPIDEALFFAGRLAAARVELAGVVVNRMHHDLLGDREPEGVTGALEAALGPQLAQRAAATLRDYHVLARRDAAGVRRLLSGLGDVPLLPVPHLDDDVHDLEGLNAVERWLFATDEQRAVMLGEVTA
jgi:anion-transporting  ArsA/GET3 family ATPase